MPDDGPQACSASLILPMNCEVKARLIRRNDVDIERQLPGEFRLHLTGCDKPLIRGNPLTKHNSLPNAHPSADAVFADAASMSLLYQNNFGSSHSERNGFLWSGLLLGGAGLVASRASRGRKIQPHRQLIPPSVSRNGGETLRFAD